MFGVRCGSEVIDRGQNNIDARTWNRVVYDRATLAHCSCGKANFVCPEIIFEREREEIKLELSIEAL